MTARVASCVLSIAAAATMLLPPSTVLAQEAVPRARPVLSLSGGIGQFDLSGTGNTPLVAVRLERTFLRPWLVGEVGLAAMRPDEDVGAQATYLVPEYQVQAQYTGGSFRPYVGAGMGLFARVGGDGPSDTEPAFTGALGLRMGATGPISGRVELRVRGIGTGFEGSSAEWTAGIGWRLP